MDSGCLLVLAAVSTILQQILSHVPRVLSRSENQSRFQAVHPVKAAEIQTWKSADAPILYRVAPFIENRQIDPAKIATIARGPDDRRDSACTQIQLANLVDPGPLLWRPVVRIFVARRRDLQARCIEVPVHHLHEPL